MNRRERRVWKKKTRRVGVVVASVAMLGASVGLSGLGGAYPNYRVDNDGPGAGNYPKYNYNCTGDDQANNYHAQNYGNSDIAC
jgi:hypothetical protein